jgi:hypothetical protein
MDLLIAPSPRNQFRFLLRLVDRGPFAHWGGLNLLSTQQELRQVACPQLGGIRGLSPLAESFQPRTPGTSRGGEEVVSEKNSPPSARNSSQPGSGTGGWDGCINLEYFR